MSQGAKNKKQSKVDGSQVTTRQKHRAPSSNLIDLNSSFDELQTPTAPNKRAKNSEQTTMDLDLVAGQQTSTVITPPAVQEIIPLPLEIVVSQESAASSILQQTPKNPAADIVPPEVDPIA